MKKIHSLLSLAAMMGMAVSCTDVMEDNVAIEDSTEQVMGDNFVAGELLIKFKTGGEKGARLSADILAMINAQVVEEIKTEAMVVVNARKVGDSGELVLVKSGMGTEAAIERLRGMPEVEYAEPNWIYQHYATSDDPYFVDGKLWGMSAGGNTFGSGAATAWTNNKLGSNTVYIGIIDEGYMYAHEDIAANAGTVPGEIADGIDNNGNGLIDDVYGWDFAGNNSSLFDGVGDDHGTHVAGTIGGVGENGKGVAGVVWNVKLLGAKFLGSQGGTTANAIKAVDYFTDLKTRHQLNIVATNNSWGGGGFSQGLKDAIDRANAAGILFIAAAGNSGTNNDATVSYPSGYTSANIIAVASITSTGTLSSFSQYGATTVDIGAPGSGIWSTVPIATGKGKNATVGSGYASYNGTSMATPHVSGAAALYASTHPGATATEIKAAILNQSIVTPSLSGKVVSNGRLNVAGF